MSNDALFACSLLPNTPIILLMNDANPVAMIPRSQEDQKSVA